MSHAFLISYLAPPDACATSIGLKISHLLKNINYNPILLAHAHVDHSIPLDLFFKDVGCEDECIIAASVRKECSGVKVF